MARGRNASKDDFQIEFVRYECSAAEDAAFDEWLIKTQANQADLIGQFIAKGWKTSLTWSDNQQAFIAASTCTDDRNRNHGKCLSSFCDDYVEAILLNIYKVTVIFGNKEIAISREKKRRG